MKHSELIFFDQFELGPGPVTTRKDIEEYEFVDLTLIENADSINRVSDVV